VDQGSTGGGDLAGIRRKLLFDKRDDVAVHGGRPGVEEGYLYRPGEVLVREDHAERLTEILARLRIPVFFTERNQLGVVHLRLAARSDIDTLLRRIAQIAGTRLAASPNHVLGGCPGWLFGPADEPFPAAAPAGDGDGDGTVWDGPLLAVVDTGLAADFASLQLLQNGVAPEDPGVFENPDEDGDGLLDPEAGHGTFIAGVVRQRTPGVPILEGRALDSDGLVDEVTLAQALTELLAFERPPDLVNLSLGGYTRDDQPLLALQFLADLPNRPLVVAAAGNNGSSRPFYPAALPWVVGVGAVEVGVKTGGDDGGGGRGPGGRGAHRGAVGVARASFSNFGPWVDACAEGVALVSTFQTGTYRSLVDGDLRVFAGGATWSGTSFATPRVAAVVAGVAHADSLSVHDAWGAVRAAAPPGPPGLGVLVD
jgi:hypothetical protein